MISVSPLPKRSHYLIVPTSVNKSGHPMTPRMSHLLETFKYLFVHRAMEFSLHSRFVFTNNFAFKYFFSKSSN